MPEDKLPGPASDLPEAIADESRSGLLSLVWLVPLVALLVAGWLGYKAISERGPQITIELADATGLEAGKTRIVYKSVQIGTVSSIELSDDYSRVLVRADMTRQAEPMLREDTRFWVVRARVSAAEVSALGTLLTGAYIGMDPGESAAGARRFAALDSPPAVTGERAGRQFRLRARSKGSLDIGSPVYFRQIEVGDVVGFRLVEDGGGVEVRVFVNAPYDRFVTANTRFWNASGAQFTVDASGVRVQTESLVALIAGGLAFAVPPQAAPGQAVSDDHEFALHEDRDTAFARTLVNDLVFIAYFDQSVRGLAVGAPVEFRGIRLGEVTAVDLVFDPKSRELRIPVTLSVESDRVALSGTIPAAGEAESNRRAFWDHLASQGLHAQLKPASLITGQLYVDLDFHPRREARAIDWESGRPEMPTVPSTVQALTTTAQRISDQLGKIPLGDLAEDLRGVLDDFRSMLRSAQGVTRRLDERVGPLLEEALTDGRAAMRRADSVMQRLDARVGPLIEQTLEQTRVTVKRGEQAIGRAESTLRNADRLLAPDSPLQKDLKSMLDELAKAARSLRIMTDYLERHPDALIRGKGARP